MSLFFRAYLKLIVFDFYLSRRNFAALHSKVRNYPVAGTPAFQDTTHRVCAAVDMACIWYWKQVLCLQRSAATACLLREYGIPAKVFIGAQQMPFKSHAWVEVEGQIVNDSPGIHEIYAVLDHC